MTDSSGALVARYAYSIFGNSDQLSGDEQATFGFAGMFRHNESGLNLTFFRGYDSTTGRWLSRDPLGERKGPNLYNYVNNTPVNLTDSLGLASGTFQIFISPTENPAGVTVNIFYQPAAGCTCKDIRFEQIVSMNGSPPAPDYNNDKPDVAYPFYPYQNHLPGGEHMQDSPGDVPLTPNETANGVITQSFETCAVCVDTLQILGCVTWHNNYDHGQHDYSPPGKDVPASDPSQNASQVINRSLNGGN
jgi:RHS repeat-associated protein